MCLDNFVNTVESYLMLVIYDIYHPSRAACHWKFSESITRIWVKFLKTYASTRHD